MRTAEFIEKEKSASTADLKIGFEAGTGKILSLNLIKINGINYTNIIKVDDLNFIIKDVATPYDSAGKYSILINGFDFTYDGVNYSSIQKIFTTASGTVLKDPFNQINYTINTVMLETGEISYTLTFDDPDNSIKSINSSINDANDGALIKTVDMNGNSKGIYKVSFRGLPAGIPLIPTFNVNYARSPASPTETFVISYPTATTIPFKAPTIALLSKPDVVFDVNFFDVDVTLTNPSNLPIREFYINDYLYYGANLISLGNNSFKIKNVNLNSLEQGSSLEDFTLNKIVYVDPNGVTTDAITNSKFSVGKTAAPETYSDANGDYFSFVDFFPSNKDYFLETSITIDGLLTVYDTPLVPGSNTVKHNGKIDKDTLATVTYRLYTKEGYSQTIRKASNRVFLADLQQTKVVSGDNSYYIDNNGNIIANGTDSIYRAPQGAYQKIDFATNNGIALNTDLNTVVA